MPRHHAPRTASPFIFDPNSLNAQLATILAEQRATREQTMLRFTAQDQELAEIKAQALKTNGRVGVLELWRETSKAKLAGISLTVGAVGGIVVWLAQILLR